MLSLAANRLGLSLNKPTTDASNSWPSDLSVSGARGLRDAAVWALAMKVTGMSQSRL